MLQKSLYASLLSISEAHNIEKRTYKPGDIVLDHESNHILYLFATGWYTVWSVSPFGTLHEVGQVDAPSTVGEGVFFGSFKKPIKIVAESRGTAYIYDAQNIAKMTVLYPHFREMLMRACLSTTNDRIREANIERTLDYTLTDTIESDPMRSIPKMLETLQKIFTLPEVLWIERHEILEDIYSLKYRSNAGSAPINEKIDMKLYTGSPYTQVTGFLDEEYAHIFSLTSRGVNYGFLVYITESPRIPGYVKRITTDIVPNCIRIIEETWKK